MKQTGRNKYFKYIITWLRIRAGRRQLDHLAIYKRGRGVELVATEKQLQRVVRTGLEPGTSRFQVRRPNDPTTLPHFDVFEHLVEPTCESSISTILAIALGIIRKFKLIINNLENMIYARWHLTHCLLHSQNEG